MSALISHDVPAGAGWSLRVKAGRDITLTALGDGANCSLLLFAADDPVDRLNIPDTMKAQLSACIKPPMVLMSDRGLALASVTGSSLDWHDCLGGHGLDVHALAHGESSYQKERNDWKRSARSLLVGELMKHGRGPADLHGCINVFSKVAPADDDRGTLSFVTGHARAGDWLTLRSELDLLVVASTVPHPMDCRWNPSAVRFTVSASEPVAPDDASVVWRAESARAIEASRVMSL